MAYDRQQILRTVRGLLASGAVAAIVATTIVVSTSITTPLIIGADPACTIDLCSAVPGEAKAEATGNVKSEVPGGGSIDTGTGGVTIDATAPDDITIGTVADQCTMTCEDITLTATDLVTLAGADIDILASDVISLGSTGGGAIGVNTGGLTLNASQAGDDITLTAIDRITVDAASLAFVEGGTGQLQVGTSGAIFNQPTYAALVNGGIAYPLGARIGSFDGGALGWNPAGVAEEAADTVALPAAAWDESGEGFEVTAWGSTAMNANNKTIRLRLGTAGNCLTGTIAGAANLASNLDTSWRARWIMQRWGANVQQGEFEIVTADGSTINKMIILPAISAGMTEADIIELCITVENATAAADLDVNGIQWRWF